MIRYSVSFQQASAHLFDVTLHLDFEVHEETHFYLPNWIPGSYMIRDFARNIITINASSDQQSIALEKIDKSTWQINQTVPNLEIKYQVYAWDLSVRSAHLDNLHGFFNGTSLFLAVKGQELKPHQLNLIASDYARSQNWQVATSMPSVAIDAQGFGEYSCENYEAFIDHPFEIADFVRFDFDVCGIPHQMVFSEAPARVDWQRVSKDVQRICEAEVKFFGDKQPPFKNYLFMTFVQKNGYGGLEHSASTALHCSYKDLPLIGDDTTKMDENYRTFLSLCCHEYFHSWNVKRIRPLRFYPMDTSQEIYTELLWFFEGITSYYDELLMVRAGVVEPSSYLDMLAKTLSKTFRGTGRFKQTVTESSFDAWTKFYKQDENAVNAITSYYAKGALIALCLDFEIRKLTDNHKSLDDLMKIVWLRYGKTNKGLGEKQVQRLAEELVGEQMQTFFDKALYSLEEFDLTNLFSELGINFQLVGQTTSSETGGFITQAKSAQPSAYLGITHKVDPLGVRVVSVYENSCAAKAGLSSGDIIIAVDNVRINDSELDGLIARIPPGETISVSYFRRDKLYHSDCLLTENSPNICYLSFNTSTVNEKLKQWLLG